MRTLWIDHMIASAKRGRTPGVRNDFTAATWMVARLAGESPDRTDGTRALGAVLGGADLVRFFVSDDYNRLRAELSASVSDRIPRRFRQLRRWIGSLASG